MARTPPPGRQRQSRDKTQTHYQGEIGDDETMAIKRMYETFDTFSLVQVVALNTETSH
jgi:hypothetical protein